MTCSCASIFKFFSTQPNGASIQSIKFQTVNFPIFCAGIIVIFWTTRIAGKCFSLVVMGNGKQVLPVLQWLDVFITFVPSYIFLLLYRRLLSLLLLLLLLKMITQRWVFSLKAFIVSNNNNSYCHCLHLVSYFFFMRIAMILVALRYRSDSDVLVIHAVFERSAASSQYEKRWWCMQLQKPRFIAKARCHASDRE